MDNVYIEKRVIEEAIYTIRNKTSLTATAKKFMVSRSTVCKDFRLHLPKIDVNMHTLVRVILNKNRGEVITKGILSAELINKLEEMNDNGLKLIK